MSRSSRSSRSARTLRGTLLVPALGAALLVSLLVASPSLAQSGNPSGYGTARTGGQFELTPYVAYRFGGEVRSNDDYHDRYDSTDIDESEAYGVTLDVPVAGGFSIELLVSRQQTQAQFDEGLFEPSFSLGDIDVTYGHVGALYQWHLGQARPFVVGSIGGTLFDPSFPGADDETRVSIGLGGGVKVFFAEHFGVRLEGRGFWTDVDDGNHRDRDRYRYGDDGSTLFQGEASAGLIFAW